MAKFTQYAIAAARQAIQDANWFPETDLQKQQTVRLYGGYLYMLAHMCICRVFA